MPPLNDPQHEAFARFVAQGKSPKDAAAIVGYSERSARNQGYRLMQNDAIRRRIDDFLCKQAEVAIQKTAISREWVITTLVENVKRSMQATPAFDDDGDEVGTYQYQGNVANKALELLGKELGMFIDRKEHRVGKITELSDEELAAMLDELADDGSNALEAAEQDTAGIGQAETSA